MLAGHPKGFEDDTSEVIIAISNNIQNALASHNAPRFQEPL